MKADQIIFISQQGWTRLAGGQASAMEPWSDIKGSALVVFDLAESELGIRTAKGQAEFAAAQIEKSLRLGGTLDGPLKVLIHRQIRYADGSQALYTALPLEVWQQLQTWCHRQPDHCLAVPVGGLLAGKKGVEHAKILRVGSQFHAFAATKSDMYYASSAALGSEAVNFAAPVRTLFEQLKSAGWAGSAKAVGWGALLCEDVSLERSTAATLLKNQGSQADFLSHEMFVQTDSAKIFSVLSGELGAAEVKVIEAPWLSKMAWLSEVNMMPLTAMVAAMALGLGAYTLFAQYNSALEAKVAQTLKTEVETLRQRVAVVNQVGVVGPESEADAFLRQIGFSASHNPVDMLAIVRLAAGSQVRIQRLQLVKPDQLAKPQFRVDGVVADGSNATLSRFLGELKAQGWQPEAMSPSDSSVGAFAYLLKPTMPSKSS